VDQAVVGGAFVHFAKGNVDATKHRVYVNVKRDHLGTAFRNIATAIWPEACLNSTKVGGPLGAARADSVVIYLSDGPRDAVLAKVRAYYDRNKGHFGVDAQAHDAGRRHARRRTGHGAAGPRRHPEQGSVLRPENAPELRLLPRHAHLHGARPDSVHGAGPGRPSALRRVQAQGREVLLHAGIDPDRPAEQSAPKALKPISELDRRILDSPDDGGGKQVVITR